MSSERFLKEAAEITAKYASGLHDDAVLHEIEHRKKHHDWILKQAEEYATAELTPFLNEAESRGLAELEREQSDE